MVVFYRGSTAKAPKLPGKVEDPELGNVRSESPSSVISVSGTSEKQPPQVPLFPEEYKHGLTGKGKRKTRKQKKRAPKKTQKRRARK